jgi:plastocyanin
MLGRVSFAALFVALGACGGSGGGDDDGGDDAPGVDAPAATVVEVSPCPATPDKEVLTDATFKYQPQMTTITQGQVVKFTMDPSHDVAPSRNMPTDPGLRVGFGATKCLRFTATGTFNFFCTPHGFTGSITVN